MLLDSILDAVGNVPMLRLTHISSGNVFAKAEFLNPGGSIKDRVAKRIIEAAEEEGALKPGMTIIEATSGNTGIGLTLIGVQKGYNVLCVMPDNASEHTTHRSPVPGLTSDSPSMDTSTQAEPAIPMRRSPARTAHDPAIGPARAKANGRAMFSRPVLPSE